MAPQNQRQYKSSQAARDRAKAWSEANRERRRQIQRDHYWRNHPERKIGLPAHERFEKLIVRIPESGCWLWTASLDRSGYGKTRVDRKDITSHRWSWIIHRGAIPAGMCVLHRCDVRSCVNPAHLFIGTQADNEKDKRDKGRHYVLPAMPGETAPAAVLKNEDALAIRRLRGRVTQVALGKRFGVHHSHISRIQTRKVWKHI